MIADAILDLLFALATWIIGLFPDNTLQLSLGGAAGYLSWVGEVVNLAAFSWALGIIVAGEVALVAVRSAMFVLHVVRG